MVATYCLAETDLHALYASDSSFSNLSFSSSASSTDSASTSASGNSSSSNRIKEGSWEKQPFLRSNSKPHKVHDTAWAAIQALREGEGKVTVGHFKLLRQLGHGDIGIVHLAQLKGTDFMFAIKEMNKEGLRRRGKLGRMQNEKEVLEFLDHPFLPTLFAHFDMEGFSYLVMEYCSGGDLHTLRLKQHDRRFGLKAARFYAAEVLMGLEYLHMMGIIYRDLKPENILVRENGHVMLTDFDLSLRCEVNPKVIKHPRIKKRSYCRYQIHIRPLISWLLHPYKRPKLKLRKRQEDHESPVASFSSFPELIAEPTEARSMSFVGTHEYIPPEIIAGKGYGSSVDWWAFGIFLYELLFGETPFKGKSNEATLHNIMKQPLRFPEGADIEVGEAARSLIQGLLVKDPKRRLGSTKGAAEIKHHAFFKGVNWALIRSCKTPKIAGFSVPKPSSKKKKKKKKKKQQLSDIISKVFLEAIPKFDFF